MENMEKHVVFSGLAFTSIRLEAPSFPDLQRCAGF